MKALKIENEKVAVNANLIRHASEIGVAIRLARHADKDKMGIHLACPTEWDVWDALETADRDMFSTIWIHSVNTF